MNIPVIESLRSENWAKLQNNNRIMALQEMENVLASQENRKPCQLGEIPGTDRILSEDMPILRGQHYIDNTSTGHIKLDPYLLQDNKPYQAIETYFHEARHDYQSFAVKNPEIHDNPTEVSDWGKNQIGYISHKNAEFSYYRWQPSEADANQIARDRTDELYTDIFQDNSNYPEYKFQKDKELADEIELANIQLGENYEQEAREAMIANYDYLVNQNVNYSQEDVKDKNEDQQYGYGYGY